MHGNHIRRVRLQPAVQLLLVRDVDGQESAMALVVAIILGVFAAVFCFAGAYEIYGSPFRGLQPFPEFGTPADNFRDAVAKGHVANGGVCGLGTGCSYEGRKCECEDF